MEKKRKKKKIFHLEGEKTFFANFFLSFFFFPQLSRVIVRIYPECQGGEGQIGIFEWSSTVLHNDSPLCYSISKILFPLFYSTRSTPFVRWQYFLPSFQGRSLFLKACLLATIHPFLLLSVIPPSRREIVSNQAWKARLRFYFVCIYIYIYIENNFNFSRNSKVV